MKHSHRNLRDIQPSIEISLPRYYHTTASILCSLIRSQRPQVMMKYTGAIIMAVILKHVRSFSHDRQARFLLPTNHRDFQISPRPPPNPPHDYEHDRPLLDQPPELPMTNNPYVLLGLDWLNPPSDFSLIHKAYKTMVKRQVRVIYHPDLLQDPDVTSEERHKASVNFARINAAYEKLKAKESEEILEYIIYVDGEKVRRYVTIKSESYYKDESRPNYDRIIAMTRYREKHPRKKLWFERKHEYDKPRHNGEWEP